MDNMKTRIAFIAAISGVFLAATGSALAADLAYKAPPPPLPPAPSWTGFYIGANGGWGWANANATVTPFGAALTDFGGGTISGNTNGAVFGGQAGYNWQWNQNWVIGIEVDVDGGGAGSSHHFTTASGLGPTGNDGFGGSSKLDYLTTVRGRIGYIWGQGLLYFTGGGAWAGFHHDGILSTNTVAGAIGQSAVGDWSNTASGYAIGAGYEWMIADHWIARGEYLYYNFSNNNNRSFTSPVCADGNPCGANINFGNANINVARFALSYKF
jgi:outer membrane immunogenic protein